MSKAYKDPTADRAISEADKWEKRQQELEALHGIKRGDTIWIVLSSYSSGEGKTIQKRIKTKVKALYPHVIQLQLPNGLTRSPTYWELERLRIAPAQLGGDTNGQEHPGSVYGCLRSNRGDRGGNPEIGKKKKNRSRLS